MHRQAIAILLVASAAAATAADLEKTVTLDSEYVELVNLVGEVTVEPAAGPQFEAVIRVRGRDAAPGLVDVVAESGREGRIVIAYPVDEHRRYVYPPLGSDRASFTLDEDGDDRGWFRHVIRSIAGPRIEVRGRGDGLEVWADVALKVPRDRAARVELKVGEITAANVHGELTLDTSHGPIEVAGHQGALVCDTGRGHVKVTRAVGEVLVDTGSGSVDIDDHVGASLKVDTGSGSVEIERTETEYLYVDTGSGSVQARQVKADRAGIDTGSGSVTLEVTRLGRGKFVIDTGSGGVNLVLPRDASATLDVECSSGAIEHDLRPEDVVSQKHGALTAKLGRGEARIIIDTGSGGVDIARR